MKADNFVQIDLSEYFNLDAISTLDDPGAGKLDEHFAIPADAMPKERSFTTYNIPFRMPELNKSLLNCMIPRDQLIDVPGDRYSALFLLGTSVYGSSRTSVELQWNENGVPEYSSEILQFTDWCHKAQFAEIQAIHSDYRLSSSGKEEPPNSIWLQVLFLPAGKTLRSIKIGSNPNMRIFAVTLGKGTYNLPAENHINYLLIRLSRESDVINRFNWLYQSLMDLSTCVDSGKLRESLADVQHRIQEEMDIDLLFNNDLDHVESYFEKMIPVLAKIRDEIAIDALRESPDNSLTIRAIGHSHLDAVWLWPWNETVSKTYRTFSKNIERLKRHEEFTFVASSAQYYDWIETYHPQLFAELKKFVTQGRWEIAGGMWVESDGNMPCGEALVRHRLYGQRYFLQHFGKLSEVEWIPDTFGMHNNFPQIIRKTGGKYFFTTKLSWNYDNEFPYQHFIWESPDGSRVLALQNPIGCGMPPGPHDGLEESVRTHNTLLKKGEQVTVNCKSPYIPEASKSSKFIPDVLAIYGEGDGGEGPSDKFIQRAQMLSLNNSFSHGTVHDHFHHVDSLYADRLPVWNDELYLENHRGTTSSQERIKKLNKKAEAALISAEKWHTLRHALSGEPVPDAGLRDAWKKLLFNQFHDILPGTSIAQAYVDAEFDFEEIFRTSGSLHASALASIAARINTAHSDSSNVFSTGRTLILFNPLAWDRNDVLCMPWGFPWVRVVDLNNEEIPSQVIFRDGRHWLLLQCTVPAFGYTQVKLLAKDRETPEGGVRIDQYTAENRFYRLRLDRDGNISELYDKDMKLNLLKEPGNRIQFFINRPDEWSNWNIDPEYDDHEIQPEGDVRIEVLDEGPVVGAFRITKPAAYGGRTVQEIRLYRDTKRIDFITDVDVKYRESLVKTSFPFNAEADAVTTEIAYGTYDRPTNPETSFEKAKIESWAQKWLDLSGDRFGVTLMSLDQYGFDVKGDRIRLTLVKGGVDPDANTDVYTHRLHYALTSHAGDWRQSRAWRQGYQYHYPVSTHLESEHEGDLPATRSFGSVKPDNIVWEVLKSEEDGSGLIVRVYEITGTDTKEAVLTLPFAISIAEEIDLLELNVMRKLKTDGNSIAFSIGHNEIKAIRVAFK